VLASAFLSRRVRDICREEGVGCIDLAGNCLLQFDDCYVEKVVDKNPFPNRGRPPSLFTPASSRVLRVLLEAPRRTWRVAALARESIVSLGQASNVTRRLLDDEYLARTPRGLRIAQPGRLLDDWREQYTMTRTARRAYYSFDREPQRLIARVAEVGRARQWRYALTSFAAASLAAPFVHGIGTIQWYVEDEEALGRWVEALDLRPVESGPNVELLLPYDPGVIAVTQVVERVTLVGNVQLYLDLSGSPIRGREQADFLRKERLGF
jgi:hypothetical protein